MEGTAQESKPNDREVQYSELDGSGHVPSNVPSRFSWRMACFIVTVVALILGVVLIINTDGTEDTPDESVFGDTSRFLLISDLHVDPLYREDCSSTTFCRTSLFGKTCTPPVGGSHPFGQAGCDTPLKLFDKMCVSNIVLFPLSLLPLSVSLSLYLSISISLLSPTHL